MTEKSNPKSAVHALTMAAMVLTISLVSFSLFKGITNIVNAFILPLVLSLGARRLTIRIALAVFLALIVLTAILFPLQLVFVMLYGGVSGLLSLLTDKRLTIWKILLYGIALSVSFWLAITLTDWIFLTQMQTILLRVLGQRYMAYIGLILLEGMIVATGQMLIARAVRKRLFVGKGAAS